MEREPQFDQPVEDSSEKKKADFNHGIASLQRMSIRDIGFVDIVSDLKRIKVGVEKSSEEEKESVRQVLKRILITLPPWRRAATFIHQYLEDFAYTPEEQAELAQERKDSSETQATIEKEVGGGISPWLARVEHNVQDAFNPLAVGFYQEPSGQIKTIYGPRYFQSKRQIQQTEDMFSGGRNEDKEVNLLSTKFQTVDRPEIMRSPLLDLLPEDLRVRFEKGEILVTGDRDVYELSEDEVDNIAASKDVDAVTEHIKSKITGVGNEKQYYFLYHSDYHSEETGRTGVLMVAEGGKVEPLVLTVGSKQFVLEIKGCGKKGGGFGRMQYRTGRDIITGGAEREQAVNEFERLSEDEQADGPKAVASILFDNKGYQQGYILRLTPSTVRASYTSSEVYPTIDSAEQVKRVVDMYAQELAEQVFAPNPKILDRSSHTENILLWGDGRHTFTDFSDHIVFSDKHYPHEEVHGGYMTPRQMLEYYIEMVEEIPGYQVQRDKAKFCRVLQKTFHDKGISLEIGESDEYSDIAKRIWERAVAYQVFTSRRETEYMAEGVLQEFSNVIADDYHRKDIALESEDIFCMRFEKGFADIYSTLRLLKQYSADVEIPHIETINTAISERNLVNLLNNLDTTFEVFRGCKGLRVNEERQIYNAISYFSGLKHTLVRPIRRYLEHEWDVIYSASNSALPEDQTLMVAAREEAGRKMQEFEKTLSNPHDMYRNLTNTAFVKNLLTFGCYQRK